MKSHSQKEVDMWAKEHPIANNIIMGCIFLVTFVICPLAIGKAYIAWGWLNYLFFAYLAGLATVMIILSIIAYALGYTKK